MTTTTGTYPDITWSRNLARFTDDLIRIPGTGIGIGADAVIGLIPGVGDLIGTGMSGAIMVDAVRQRVPLHILTRMGWNLLVDTGLGFVPVAGDALDVLHRANRKNYRLLEECVLHDRHVADSTRGYLIRASLVVAGAILTSLALVAVLLWGLIAGLGALAGSVGG